MPEGESSKIYLILLGVINGGALVIAMYQAYQARDIQTEFAESKYIAFVMFSFVEAVLVGLPVLLLDRENARVKYFETAIICILLCLAILGFIFVPKFLHQRKFDAAEAERNEKKRVHVTGMNQSPTPLSCSAHSHEDGSVDDGMKVYFWKRVSLHSRASRHLDEHENGDSGVGAEEAKDH